jgi:DNA-binding transcriptional LysR family regulator
VLNPLHLRTLRAVLSAGSFADAGRLLGYTASAVSQHISALELATGVVLFDREPHSVHPTAVALALAERAQGVLTALEDLDQEAKLLATGHKGRLRIGAFTTASTCIIPPALATFMALRPRAQVQLVEAEPEPLLTRLLDGELDLVLIYAYDIVPRIWPTEVAVQEVFCEELVLMAPISHPLAVENRISMYDLAKDVWIATGEHTDGAIALERICASHGFMPKVGFRSDSYGVIRALVRAGLGISIVPLLGHQADSGIKSTSLTRDVSCRRVLAAQRKGNSNPLLSVALGALAIAAHDERLRSTAPPGWCLTRYDLDAALAPNREGIPA